MLVQVVIALLLLGAAGCPAAARPQALAQLKPDPANVAYGPHESNVLDLWLAAGDSPRPLVICYHGGGFSGGDKSQLNQGPLRSLLPMLLETGISAAAANCRLSGIAPHPAQMHDAARALQFLRLHAKEYNINPERVGAIGPSAGAGISQWLASHDDLADPSNEDALLRQSTRLAAVVAIRAQTTHGLRVIGRLMNSNQVDRNLVQFFTWWSP
jgi:acetyl esterase/lipase